MKHRFGSAALASLLVIPASGGTGQEPTPPTFKVGTAVVTLDLVVHDKRGRRVADLRADEIEIQEDGAKREIVSFRFVERAAAAKDVAPAPALEVKAPSGDEALRLLNLVSLVFDILDDGSRPVARKAALSFLAADLPPDTRMAVFQISQAGLRIVQPFTEDKGALEAAVEAATAGVDRRPPSLTAVAQAAAERYHRLLGTPGAAGDVAVATTGAERPTGQRTSTVSGPAEGPPGASGGGLSEVQVARFEATVYRSMDRLERQIQGETSLRPLLALIKGQESVSGRKSILYFAGGLKVPPKVDELFARR